MKKTVKIILAHINFDDILHKIIFSEVKPISVDLDELNLSDWILESVTPNIFPNIIDILEKFKEIIIAVDNDAAGAECKKQLLKRLPEVDKMRSIDWGKYKDANEALKDGESLNRL